MRAPVRALAEALICCRAGRPWAQAPGSGPVRLQLFTSSICRPFMLVLSAPQVCITTKPPLQAIQRALWAAIHNAPMTMQPSLPALQWPLCAFYA